MNVVAAARSSQDAAGVGGVRGRSMGGGSGRFGGAVRAVGRALHLPVRGIRRATHAHGAGESGLGKLIELHAVNGAGDMMITVVQHGTGQAARIPGVSVAGKTGTAQTQAGSAPHAWFAAFAPAQSPRVAVAVLVEHGGSLGNDATGGQVAAPIAKAVIQAVLGQ